MPVIAAQPCRIDVVEKESGWPVSLVELRTNHGARFVSDNAGRIAFDLPELMGERTWFFVESPGYGVAPDGFGYRGVRLTPQPGATLTVEVEREIIARRLGRLTGAGLFAESQKLGLELDATESRILGCDSIQNAVHDGLLYWVWGDTTLARYPLGIFNATAATTAIQPLASFEPPLRLEYDYFVGGDGRPRGVAPIPGPGPTWLGGFVSLPDAGGTNHLVCSYVKIEPPLTTYQFGVAEWNATSEEFDLLEVIWEKSDESPEPPDLLPNGHPMIWEDESGQEWLLFGNPLPRFRCPATYEAWRDSSTWEALDPPAVLLDADGAEVNVHSGSAEWHPWRERWTAIFVQSFGESSFLGEVWYAEAAEPTGPWGTAVKVLTHDKYTFYNPRIHPEFAPADSPMLFFEGTYTHTFSGNEVRTPRHDYNQILYRLDLDDPRLEPARTASAVFSTR